MTQLFLWLGQTIANALGDAGLWGAIKTLGTSFWAIAIFWVGLAYLALKLVGDLTIRAFQQLAVVLQHGVGSVGDPCGGALISFLAIANTFFPLDEMIRLFFQLIVGIWLPIGIYRLIKSFIPTVAT